MWDPNESLLHGVGILGARSQRLSAKHREKTRVGSQQGGMGPAPPLSSSLALGPSSLFLAKARVPNHPLGSMC